jgi:hypothetical protein
LIYPELFTLGLAFLGGLFATLLMTLTEIPSWRRFGLQGVLEWHENQVLSEKFFKLARSSLHIRGIFLLHFLNGGLGGVGFLLALSAFPFAMVNLYASGVIYGFFLWLVTLVPIHKPITGISPWKHPMGKTPAVASLIGHIVYGFVIGYFFLNLPI